MLRKSSYTIALLLLIATFILPAFTPAKTPLIRAETYFSENSHSINPSKPSKPTKTNVNIRNIVTGDTVYNSVLIIAQVTGTFETVIYQIDNDLTEYTMSPVVSTDRFQATWDTTTVPAGAHKLYVKAKSSTGTVLASDSVTVTVVTSYKWEIYIEIDYIAGHEPTEAVLNYMVSYWEGHAIKVEFLPDDIVSDPTPEDGYISSSDFWVLENAWNDVWMYDDRSYGGADPKYILKEKWMLYGTWDEDANVGGYTYVQSSGRDITAGNYIFIADGMIDNWEAANGIDNDGGEVVVVCHEAGHSIGITVLRLFSEKYDPDVYSVMSYIRLENAKYIAVYWYYSKEYWNTANLDYYII